MAAASAVKDEPSETGHGENQNNLPLKVEGNQDCFKTTSIEKPGLLVEGGKAPEKSDKAEQPVKKFVDAPLPATNAWTKRSSSLTSAVETNQSPQVLEVKKEVPLNDKAAPQVNAAVQKAGKGNKAPASNVDSVKNEKPKAEGVKNEKPKAEGVKNEKPKAEGVKNEKPKAEGVKNEKPKAEGVKNEKPKAEGVKNEKPKAEGVKNEKPKAEGVKNEKPKAEGVKNEKPKAHKSKTELNGNKQTDNNQKPKIKMFGEDYIEAPLPTVNPWKKPAGLTLSSGLVSSVEQDPTPAAAAAAAAAAAVVVSPSLNTKDLWTVEKPFQADPKKDPNPPERQISNEAEPKKATSPAVVDDSWPALHEVKVTEPNQTMPPKATKSPRVKASPAASTTTTAATTTGATPVVSGIASAPVVTSVEVSSSPSGQTVSDSVDTQTAQTQTQTDSGGDDSSKENKESTTNDDDTSNAVRSKKGTKPKWQRMEIEHPKPDRRHRRSRSQGRGFSPPRRGGRPAGDRFNRPNSRRSEAGPDSQNWRANMVPQASATPNDPTTNSTATESTVAADPAHATTVNTMDRVRGMPGINFTGNRNPRGRGGLRGNGLRRGGNSRGRGGVRDTNSPPFQPNPNIWSQEQVFPTIAPDQETIQVPWSQGFNRVHNVPRVPPLSQVVLGMEANLFLQEQLLSLLGQTPMYYDMTSNTYPQHPPPPPPQPSPPSTLKYQVEYYFSDDNLVKDHYLRKKMDKHGWVALHVVLSFNKVQQMNADYKSLIEAIRSSDKLELSENEDHVRTLNYPHSWPLEPDFTSLPPPIEVQRVAAMSTLHSDAPEFVPGQPFVLRNLASSMAESIPVMKEDDDVLPNSESQETPEEEEDSLECAAASNLANVAPMLSSR